MNNVKPPWRNRYIKPEGTLQEDWDREIRHYERLAAVDISAAKHVLAHLPRAPIRMTKGDVTIAIPFGAQSMSIAVGKRFVEIPIADASEIACMIVAAVDDHEQREGNS